MTGRRTPRPIRRPFVAALAASIVVCSVIIALSSRPAGAVPIAPGSAPSAAGGTGRVPPAIPAPGHEVYGFVPYWEMDDGIAAHLAKTELTTLGLFSVTHKKSGALATAETGYRRITADRGRRLIAEAHDRSLRVELVYTTFGAAKNEAFFTDPAAQDRTIEELVALAGDLGVDGINVDAEQVLAAQVLPYGDFVGRLREALRAIRPDAQVSVATTSGPGGAAMALAASVAGADRIFLMGYDYHWSGSEPGASAPLGRRDGSLKSLPWSLDLYREAGVPAERTILGLPLYGMSWPVATGEPGAATTGRGAVWIPRRNLATLRDPTLATTFDPIEGVEHLVVPDGAGWRAIYFDSPATLVPKLLLADERGLAGAGFWAVGYERGLADYTRLIATFRAGELR
jgi:spore germination protein